MEYIKCKKCGGLILKAEAMKYSCMVCGKTYSLDEVQRYETKTDYSSTIAGTLEQYFYNLKDADAADLVNKFLDKVINQVEEMVNENNKCLEKLEQLEQENEVLKTKLEHFENVEGTLNRAIMMAQKTTDQMKVNAHKEADMIIEEAKKNANRIVNESLIRAEKTENEANNLTKNIYIFKKRLRNIIESQLEMVNDIDKIEL